jgi:hypothetical protein
MLDGESARNSDWNGSLRDARFKLMTDSSAVERARVCVYKDQKLVQYIGRGRLGCGKKGKEPQRSDTSFAGSENQIVCRSPAVLSAWVSPSHFQHLSWYPGHVPPSPMQCRTIPWGFSMNQETLEGMEGFTVSTDSIKRISLQI